MNDIDETTISPGGSYSVAIWKIHGAKPTPCECGHCAYVEAHLDDDDDTQRDSIWT